MSVEFARDCRLDTLGEGAREVAIVANPEECAALARRFDLIAVHRLAAQATLVRQGEVVTATGRMRAAIVQPCAASGEPLDATFDEPFTLRFVPETPVAPDAEVELDASDLDEVFYTGGAIDLGEAVAETLSLAIDPFARRPDADAALRRAGVANDTEASPFAVLKGLFGNDA